MKKRITAFLLCLVMALSLIPTTVWAVAEGWSTKKPSGSVVSVYGTTTTYGDEKNAIKSGPLYSSKWYKQVSDKKNTNNQSFTIPQVSDLFELNDGWELAYVTVAANSSGQRQPGASFLLSSSGGSMVYYFKKSTPTPPPTPDPEIPDPDVASMTKLVDVYCTREQAVKTTSDLISGTYATSVNKDSKTCTITINNVAPYVALVADHKDAGNHSTTITLSYNGSAWVKTTGATVNVVCEEDKPADPIKPSDDEVKNLLTQNITVVDDTDLHAKKNYKLKDVANSFTVGDVTTNANGDFVCPVTIEFQPFVDQYSKDVKKTHTLTNASVTNTVVELVASYNTETKTWTWAAAKADRYATIYVECEVPAAPTDAEIAKLGKVRVICNTNDKHETKVYDLIPGTYTTTIISQLTGKPVESEVYYDEDYEQFVFDIAILNQDEYGADSVDGIAPYVDKYVKEFGAHAVVNTFTMCTLAYNEESGEWELLQYMIYDEETDEAVLDEYYGAARISVQCVNDPTAKDLKDLGVTVDVDCKAVKHTAKDYGLTGNETLTVTKKEANGVWTATVSLSDDSAKAFLKQYSKDIGESHTNLLTSGTIDLVFENGAWKLADAKKNVLNITTDCSTTGGNTNPGTTPGTRRPYTKAETKTVESGKTFDAGIAMYVGLSILSVTGSAVVIRKRKDF